MKSIAATQFKAQCLALLDEVGRTGEVITITKRGQPVARLVGPVVQGTTSPQATLKGTVRFIGDIVDPPLPSTDWEAIGDGET